MSEESLAILERLERIEAVLDVPKNIGIDWLAAKLGVSDSYLRNHRYLLPNHGISDVPGRWLWDFNLAIEWIKTPLRTRELQWLQMGTAGKRQIMKAWRS
jgi:hypothetical protein